MMDKYQKKRFEEINKLIFVQQYELAEQQLAILAEECQNPAVHIRRVELALKLNKIEILTEEYNEYYEQEPEGEFATLFASLSILCKQFSEKMSSFDSIASYQRLLKSSPNNIICYYGIAIALESSGQLDRAAFNYEQALKIDAEFYPSYFGLSQIFYQQGNQKQGDSHFFMFENAAPYNVYGNFETHRKLTKEFVAKEKYKLAEKAVTSLKQWWLENKSECPVEIKVFEQLALARIYSLAKELHKAQDSYDSAKEQAYKALTAHGIAEGVYFFLAKLFEEYTDETKLVEELYARILSNSNVSADLVQKIGSHLLAFGKLKISERLFSEAFSTSPDHSAIRFCLLVSRLRIAGVDVEEYLQAKDRLQNLLENNGDKVELLALLHNLQARFANDAEVHMHLAAIYSGLSNQEKEKFHIDKMLNLDPQGKDSILAYTDYLVRSQQYAKANEQLQDLLNRKTLDENSRKQLDQLNIELLLGLNQIDKALTVVNRLLLQDPWDLNYLIKKFHCFFEMTVKKGTEYLVDLALEKVEKNINATTEDWDKFDKMTEIYQSLHFFDFVYLRRKIRFLYSEGEGRHFRKLLASACDYNLEQGQYDLLRLINTNFDTPDIYIGLGSLAKNFWQHEVALMWFKQASSHPNVSKKQLGECYQEIADCYNWGSHDFSKALEYGNLALELGALAPAETYTSMAHAYLKLGNVRSARKFLEKIPASHIEGAYLKGLLDYREGREHKAKAHWKPLLTVQSSNIKIHHIKQDIHRYYFRQEDYLKAN
ncbi:MAG: hypothetical protein KBD78_03825 [Oligoflexales bacterium]|nr:hypothetical protein [Oligoflexales bacterium]